MMKFLFTVLCISFFINAKAQTQKEPTPDSIAVRLVLIGDAGQFTNGKQPVLDAVRNKIKFDKKTTVLYVGDNLYKEGLPDEMSVDYMQSKAVLDSQANIAKGSPSKVYFIPGNHDWERGRERGWEAILREEHYINLLGDENVKFFPEGGCPGPVEVNLSDDVVMVLVDTQWWLQVEGERPGIESDCDCKTEEEVLVQLEDIFAKNSKKLVIFATHHPFKSQGIHGGYFTLKQHIFPFTDWKKNLWIPLPVIGSVYPVTRSVFGTIQDLPHPRYSNMIRDVQAVAKQHPNVIFVAGHEHTLQYIKDSSYNYIISGSGSKTSRVSESKKAPFVSDKNGFAVLNISKNKNVDLKFYTLDDPAKPDMKEAFATHVLNFSAIPNPIAGQAEVEKATPVTPVFKDSIVAAANEKIAKTSGMQRWIMGKNYRKEWSTPVKMRVFNLKTELGGFKIKSLGGGKQTKSLKLEDKQGREWTLRTVTKNPVKAIPQNFANTIGEDIAIDFISASHPYVSLIVPDLSDAIDVIGAKPMLFYVPDDPAFGYYKPLFANTVCMLERRDPTPDNSDTKSTAKIVNKMLEDNDDRLDQKQVLSARLLDIVIGDWDRHFDQWKWGVADTGKGKLYYPVPRDRDQAMFLSDGFAVKRVSKRLLPFLRGFKNEYSAVNWLSHSARDFDRFFLNKLDESNWDSSIVNFQSRITDEVIDKAVKKLPPEIYAIDGETIKSKLRDRRDALGKAGKDYYKFLSKEVDIVGTNKKEYFKITSEGKNLVVNVYKRNSDTDSFSVMYNRTFDPNVTKEIRLYGLNEDDIFDIDENVKSPIKVRIIGGLGKDTFDLKGNVANYVYDYAPGKNHIINDKKTHNKITDKLDVNRYDPTNHQYNEVRFPKINLGYNAEDFLMVGVGFTRKTFAFRKEPYASFQKLQTLVSTYRGSYQINYSGEFNERLAGNDILVNARLVNPVMNNFFGLGNETVNEKGRDFYRVRYNNISADVLLRKRIGNLLSVSLGPTYYYYWNHLKDNEGKILNNPSFVGLDSVSVYQKKHYLGGKLNMTLDFIDNVLLPTRGIYWATELSSVGSLRKNSQSVTKIESNMTVYASLRDPAMTVAVFKLGAGHIFNREFEYFQALNLGQNNYLRGFRKNRFSGSSMLYTSLEIRQKLFKSHSYALPGDFGLVGFTDVGRVWMKGENSKKWHSSVGGGFYFTPFDLILLSFTAAYSKEETLLNFTLGTKFNLTF